MLQLTDQQKQVLQLARDTYGTTKQILVSNEELCELAAVCAKFPRYDDEHTAQKALYEKAVGEVADVIIVLDHIINIFRINDKDLSLSIEGKINRLNGWLQKSTSSEQTTIDRDIPSSPCKNCSSYKNWKELKPGGTCFTCKSVR